MILRNLFAFVLLTSVVSQRTFDTTSILNDGLVAARRRISGVREMNTRSFRLGRDRGTGRSSARLHSLFFRQYRLNKTEVENGMLNLAFTNAIINRTSLTRNDMIRTIGEDRLNQFLRRNFPACSRVISRCRTQVDTYRTASGRCNNLNHPEWGRALVPQKRLLQPVYADDVQEPRTSVVPGRTLPSPRYVSNVLHRGPQRDILDSSLSYWFMQFGQFLDHDITLTPIVSGEGDAAIDCCAGGTNEERPDVCFPIRVSNVDPHFSTRRITCISFVRSAPANLCPLSRREQLNDITSYIDGSMIYGSSIAEQRELRSGTHGLLRTTPSTVDNQKWLPSRSDRRADCVFDSPVPTQFCHKAGDERVNENPTLTTVHTLFVREHNRIAKALWQRHPTWNDEKLFQESRKIVAAIMQHITYNEFLPTLLGDFMMRKFGLYESKRAYNNVYDKNVDATISNSFSTATYRFGHTVVRNDQKKLNRQNNLEESKLLSNLFFNPGFSQTGSNINGMARWMNTAACGKPDRFFAKEVRDNLFRDDAGVSADLVSLNIQRGRDHGLPGYNAWRRFCGLTPFDRTRIYWHTASRANHELNVANILAKAYVNDEDIDLFAGAMSETLQPGAQVGPLFACLIANEFKSLKVGDRYYFENYTRNKKVGFTGAQLQSIKRFSFAKLICTNANIPVIQANIFRQAKYGTNPPRYCASLPALDLNPW